MGISIGEYSGSDATNRLRETIIDLDKSTKRQTTWMIWLTLAIALMTLALLALTIVLVVREPSDSSLLDRWGEGVTSRAPTQPL